MEEEEMVTQPDYNSRVTSLEKEVHGLNASIGKVEANQASQQRAIENIGANVEKLIDQRQSLTPGFVFGIVAMIGAFFFGIAEYNQSQNAPQDLMIELLTDKAQDLQSQLNHKDDTIEQWRAESHYEVAQQHAFQEYMKSYMEMDKRRTEHHDDLYHQLDARVRELEGVGERGLTAMRALGDYVKEHTAKYHPEPKP